MAADVPAIKFELRDTPAVICVWDDSDDEYVTRWFDARPEFFRLVAELIEWSDRRGGDV